MEYDKKVHNYLAFLYSYTTVAHKCACTCGYTHVHTSQGWIQGGLWGLETPLQKYIKEAKRVM